MSRLLSASLLSLLLASGVFSQTSTGTINGMVQDATGANVAGARVRILGTDTGEVVRELVTGAEGLFAAPLLRPSNYTVEVSATGFKRLTRSGVTLRVDDILNLRLALEVGSLSEAVTVSASAELLEQTTNTVGQTIDNRTMQQLPLNGRNYLQLGGLTAGTVPNTRTRDQSFSAYGNRGLQNAFLLDGARNQNYLRGLDNRARDAMRPSLEAISEFKVQTSNYSAEYGASAGAVVTVVTKSGTNDFHGSALEFLRNNAFDARDYFLLPSAKKPLFIEHQFGGSAGGKIVTNRAWWHAAYQRTHISQGSASSGAVPLPQERAGVFAMPIFDPLTTRANPAGAGSIRDPFPSNAIPTNRFDPIGKNLVDRYPNPQLPGAAINYFNNPLLSTRSHNATVRGDFKISDKDTLFARWSLDQGAFGALPLLPLGAQTGVVRDVPARSWGVGYTRIIKPTMINELRFAYNKVGLTLDATEKLENLIPGSLAGTVQSGMPTINVAGYAGIGARPANFDNVPVTKISKVYNLSDNVSIVHGKHTTKLGFDFQYIDAPTFATLDGRGSFGFTGVFTQNPQRRPGSGSSVADILLGLPNTITVGTPSDAKERARNTYFYVQHDWNVTTKLTLNAGLRYEITSPFYDANNRLANLVLDSGNPLYGQYVLAGDSRLPRALQALDKNNFAPRAGFAYKAGRGMVVRGGFGIFFAQDEGFGVSQRMTNNPPFVGFGGYAIASDQLSVSSTIPLSGKLPARPAPIDPASYKLDPKATAQIRSWSTQFTLPYVEQWNLNIQKEVTKDLVWEFGYVGNHGVKLYGAYEGNQPLPGPGAVNSRRPLGAIYSGSILKVDPWVTSNYQRLTTRLERRFAGGFSLLGVYTFSKSLDMQTTIDLCDGCTNSSGSGAISDTRNRRLNYGLSDHHTAHRVVVSGFWELPFGKGRRFVTSGAGAAVAGGWALSGISTLSGGLPMTLNLNFDNANTGTTNWPNRVGNGKLDNPSVGRWFDTSAFVFPAQYTIGNAGRNILTGPGTANLDVSIQRTFRIPVREGMRAEFRGEAFNLTNTPQLGQPALTLGTAQFGTISSTARANRQLQLGLKFIF